MELASEIFNSSFWYIAPILVTLCTTLSGFIINTFGIATKWKQPISWAVGTALSCISIATGFLGSGIGWQSYIAMSIVVGLSSNGIYDVNFIQNWINNIFPNRSKK